MAVLQVDVQAVLADPEGRSFKGNSPFENWRRRTHGHRLRRPSFHSAGSNDVVRSDDCPAQLPGMRTGSRWQQSKRTLDPRTAKGRFRDGLLHCLEQGVTCQSRLPLRSRTSATTAPTAAIAATAPTAPISGTEAGWGGTLAAAELAASRADRIINGLISSPFSKIDIIIDQSVDHPVKRYCPHFPSWWNAETVRIEVWPR